jgi:hypothetical protein
MKSVRLRLPPIHVATTFGHEVIEAFYHGMKHRPDSTFGTFNDDFPSFKDPGFQRGNLCSIILGSRWER